MSVFSKRAMFAARFVKSFISLHNIRFCLNTRKFVTKTSHHVQLPELCIEGQKYCTDEWTNVPPHILSLVSRKIYKQPGNPLNIITTSIHEYFKDYPQLDFSSPVVSVEDNFDSLLVSKDHVSRSKSQTYYVNKNYLLRCHTSAHQAHCLKEGVNSFLCIADVYRRDAIDRSHYPCFHQCEVFKLFSTNDLKVNSIFNESTKERNEKCQEGYTEEATKHVEHHLKSTVEGYIKYLLGNETKTRWVSAYFPFTHPSFEFEISYNGKWLEILGCGVVEQKLLEQCERRDQIGWAIGFGLERLAMIKFSIPDIRLFWTKDTGFLNQFKRLKHTDSYEYKPVSKFPQCIKDISFWLPENNESFDENDLNDIVHSLAEGIVEQVELIDDYTNKKGRRSHCYRIVYRSNDRTLTNAEINELHEKIGLQLVMHFNVEIR